ncbi:hypothetical protein H4582DRAFT_2095276 [Lactarius indigo]|nr:hypothetical protein H4582DRAFT_2095276 [Lactarius indigo]
MIRHSIRMLTSTICASRAYERLPSTFSCLECHQMRVLAMLLEHTPRLQHAAWKHLDPGALSTSALPALRTLHVMEMPGSPATAGRALLHGGAALELLGSVCVDAVVLEALAHMRGEALCRLEVASFESIAVLVHAVRLFPRLRWLRIPAVDYWHEHSPVTPASVHLGEWVEGACGAARAGALHGGLFFELHRAYLKEEFEASNKLVDQSDVF